MSTTATAHDEIINNRYILGRRLGQGGMGAVFQAYDRLTGQTVALKRVTVATENLEFASRPSATDASGLRLALAHEFQTLASLRHPYIVSVLDYGFDEDRQPYFTMSLIKDARTLIEAGRELPLDGKIRLITQMLQALAYLHRRGVVHRDLKPGNVLVNGQGVVQMLDFGLAVGRENPDEWEGMAGTLAYMAPEMLDGAVPSAAADLYAVGVLIYEMLVGRHPYMGDDTEDFFGALLRSDADMGPLIDLQPPAPSPRATSEIDAGSLVISFSSSNAPAESLATVVQTLLERDPLDRCFDADSALLALNRAAGLDVPVETSAIRESYLQAARFVGRETEMNQLNEALRASFDHRGSAWLIGGESGVGKSRLVEELRTRALVKGAMVLRGLAVSDGGLPYQLWRAPLRRMILNAPVTDFQAGVLQAIIPDIATLLGRAIPAAPVLEGPAGQQRLITTIIELFQSSPQPIMLILEDLQWAAQSLDVLQRLAVVVGDMPLLIVGTYRSEERPTLPDELPNLQAIKLERLERGAIRELSEAMLGEQGGEPQLVDLLMRETEGNVFFLVEVVRALAENAGQLTDIGRDELPRTVFAGGVQYIIQRRLDRVPESDRPLLALAAVIGRELDLPLLRVVEPRADTEALLTHGAAAAVLDFSDGHWRFAHDKLRETLLAGLDPIERQGLHRRVAEAIERTHVDHEEQAGVLAYHWGGAGDPTRERLYATRAGRYMQLMSSFRESKQWLKQALTLLEQTSGDTRNERADILYWLGDAADGLSEYADALGYYQESLTLARALEDRQAAALALMGMGTIRMNQGGNAEAMLLLNESLGIFQAIGDSKGESEALRNLGIGRAYAGEFENAIGYWQQALIIDERLNDRRSVAAEIGNIGAAYNYLGRNDLAIDHYLRALAIRRELGERRGVANDLGNLGNAYTDIGQLETALTYYEQALEIRRSIGDRRGEANDLGNFATLLTNLGRFDDAITALERSLAINSEIGDRHGEGLALGNLGAAYSWLGDWNTAVDFQTQALAKHREVGNRRSECHVLGSLGYIYHGMGRTDEALTTLKQAASMAYELNTPELIVPYGAYLAEVELRLGELESARETVTQARKHDFPEHNHHAALIHALVLARLDDPNALVMFDAALALADGLLATTPGYVRAVYSRALALTGCGLLTEGEHRAERFAQARAAYRHARQISSADGVVALAGSLFDELMPLDSHNALMTVRSALMLG